MDRGPGFYSLDGNDLLHAPNFVFDAEFTLLSEEVEEYKSLDVLPIDGWHWFDTIEDACLFFNIPLPEGEDA